MPTTSGPSTPPDSFSVVHPSFPASYVTEAAAMQAAVTRSVSSTPRNHSSRHVTRACPSPGTGRRGRPEQPAPSGVGVRDARARFTEAGARREPPPGRREHASRGTGRAAGRSGPQRNRRKSQPLTSASRVVVAFKLHDPPTSYSTSLPHRRGQRASFPGRPRPKRAAPHTCPLGRGHRRRRDGAGRTAASEPDTLYPPLTS